jgi:hypothetical protein
MALMNKPAQDIPGRLRQTRWMDVEDSSRTAVELARRVHIAAAPANALDEWFWYGA